jgi:pullulanase
MENEIKSPIPILFAAADSPNTVLITLPVEPADYRHFAVYDKDRKLACVSGKADEKDTGVTSGVFRALISLSDQIDDPSKSYIVRDESGLFGEQKVTMRHILDGYYYGGSDLGLVYGASESVFKVWAPTAAEMYLALYDDAGAYDGPGEAVSRETSDLRRMGKDPATGVWSIRVSGDLEGKFYLYHAVFSDGTAAWAADPYAKAVSANGLRMAVVDPEKTNPPGFNPRKKPPFRAGAWQDAVICELHVRDFSIDENSGMRHRGKYLAFTERGTVTKEGVPTGVDHLVRLNITHVHLLPVFDFASINELAADAPDSAGPKFNWGYDPMHFNVPEGSYSTDPKNPYARIIEFKAMVQALHDAGIRVIMDVVFNHTYRTGGWPFDALVPGYYYRLTDTGSYANGSGCGNEIASERPMVRKFIIDSCRYWAGEYNVDGFRFDLMGLIDTPTMKLLTEELRRDIDPTLIIYGEPWQAGGSVLPPELQTITGAQHGLGFAVFNDRIRTAIKGGSDDDSRGFATGGPSREEAIVRGVMGSIHDFTSEANESVNYVTAHDNLNLWDKICFSLGEKKLALSPHHMLENGRDIFDTDAVKSSLLANGIILTSQGIPFFQAGDEMLRSKYGDHNSYASPDDINKIRWENAYLYRKVIDYYAGLIRLRKEHPAFRQTLGSEIDKTLEILNARDMVVSFILKENAAGDPWRTIFVAYNGSSCPKEFTLPAAVPVWQLVVDSRRAGTESLAEFSGVITLPSFSMTVLHE